MELNIQKGTRLAEEGVARSDSNASLVRKEAAAAAIRALAARKLYFSSEDVWSEMEANGVFVEGRHGSFLGAALRKAAKEDQIELAVGVTLPSARPSNHLRIMRVWKSKLIDAREHPCPACGRSGVDELQQQVEKLQKELQEADDLIAQWVNYSERQKRKIASLLADK